MWLKTGVLKKITLVLWKANDADVLKTTRGFLIVQQQYGCKMFVGIRWHASCMFLPCFSHSKEKDVWHLEALRRPDWNFPPCRFSGNKHQSRRQIMSPDQRRAKTTSTSTSTSITTSTTTTAAAAVWSEPGRVSGGNVGGAHAGQVWKGRELHDNSGFECRSSREDDREERGRICARKWCNIDAKATSVVSWPI